MMDRTHEMRRLELRLNAAQTEITYLASANLEMDKQIAALTDNVQELTASLQEVQKQLQAIKE
ncbi:hypothetical protein [Paucilactobacillus nenjiangensis]|jgi:chromosome segregation ATPase|uniref:hypothetical protein n=1 Tax=Paucilactobacillus nenjiangensis TaxID=1296540 RepID=UPI0010F8EC4D|nr:hypothetical protein [Paucilactobacillus nenjiangensis]